MKALLLLGLSTVLVTANCLNFTMRTISSHSLTPKQNAAVHYHPEFAAWRRRKRQNDGWTWQPLHDYFDEFYLGSVVVGTPPQELWLSMDTGSSIMWVIDGACYSAECLGYPNNGRSKRKFYKSLSSTFKWRNGPFSMSYKTGWTSGKTAEDTVRFGGFTVLSHHLGIADKVAPFLAQIPIDGVFGLGLPSNSASGDMLSPMELLLPHLNKKIITVWMNRKVAISRGSDAGYITYGAVDTSNCEQNWNYIPISSNMHWRIPVQGFNIGGFNHQGNNEQALCDTGSSYLGAPRNVMNNIARITGATFSAPHGVYTVPCPAMWTLPSLLFRIGGRQYRIPSVQYVIDMNLGNNRCALAFYAMDYDGNLGISWILGVPFIRTFCTIFDYGQKRVGFAIAIPR
ncbi:eukaryotic aspartyl protease [Ancylostoma caninum]|uniref:Eukaryotic aspartyl protease n=1 Tax=Ancylostoma caninum TaxID=29170 RepID=A0A368GBI4_ANCCA|nr:eukaryotic aspartyl protease [Ancylostoma caninum]